MARAILESQAIKSDFNSKMLSSHATIDRSRIYCSPSLVTVATSDKLKFVFDIQRGKNPDC